MLGLSRVCRKAGPAAPDGSYADVAADPGIPLHLPGPLHMWNKMVARMSVGHQSQVPLKSPQIPWVSLTIYRAKGKEGSLQGLVTAP